ncbi:MAG: Holliday junction branch migration protein RuvA [Syntrophales bacterium]|nr:Holliday junction branch migration protein RuvA [Syntrophales bacterium]
MIARISGTLIYKHVTHVVVDAHGIGYRVFVPLTTFYELPDIGQPVNLNIHTHVKQDSINLFGFCTSEERDIFQLMISVTGIGPRLAMNILSGISAREWIRAVSQGNLNCLVNIPGLGKKLAQRLILELKDKVMKLGANEVIGEPGGEMTADELVKKDALSALINLGYKSHKVGELIERVINESKEALTLDVLLKKTLKILAG